jgi:hypothetical protein
MSYRDPYANQYGASNGHYDQEYNPYAAAGTAHQPYNNTGYNGYNSQSGYRDDPSAESQQAKGPHRQSTMRSFLTGNDESTDPNHSSREKAIPPMPPMGAKREDDEVSGFDQGEFTTRGK